MPLAAPNLSDILNNVAHLANVIGNPEALGALAALADAVMETFEGMAPAEEVAVAA